MKIKGILIDVKNEKVETIEIDKTLKEYYRILNCDTIDITERKIGDNTYDIICDDEGLFKSKPKISAITKQSQPALVGNLFIVKFDGREDETSLDDEDIELIMKHIKTIYTNNSPQGYPMLTDLEY